jgi:hypothetical protein
MFERVSCAGLEVAARACDARGMSTREIVGHLRDLYGIEVSPDLISAVTDAAMAPSFCSSQRPRISLVTSTHAERDMHSLVPNQPFVADLDPRRVEEN